MSRTRDESGVESIELRVRVSDWTQLTAHLFPGDHDEHGAVLLCGLASSGTATRLLVREVALAQDGTDYVPGSRGYRHLNGEFVTHQLRRAKELGLVYLAVHNHGGSGRVSFSGQDQKSHERAYPTLLSVSGKPVGALVLAKGASAGVLWAAGNEVRPINVTTVIGDKLEFIDDGATRELRPRAHHEFARQALVFGDTGQRRLADLRIGIVGAGGVGMLVIQALARLGVGNFVVIDPDIVSPSNLSRLPEARRRDAYGRFGPGLVGRLAARLGLNKPALKVALASRIVDNANSASRVEAIAGDVADDAVARRILNCDFIFLAADTMLARDVVNQIAYQYSIPSLQIGSKVVIDKTSGDIRDIFGVVRSIGSEPGCLRCNGLIDAGRLAAESLADPVQLENQRYVDEPGIEAPSVITLNAMAVGWAVNDFMQYAVGIGRPRAGFRVLRSLPTAPEHPQLVVQTPHVDMDCHVCGHNDYSVLARGDDADLPTRIDPK